MLGLERFLQSNDYPASEIILTATYLLIRPASFTCWLLLACPFPLLSIFLHFPIDFLFADFIGTTDSSWLVKDIVSKVLLFVIDVVLHGSAHSVNGHSFQFTEEISFPFVISGDGIDCPPNFPLERDLRYPVCRDIACMDISVGIHLCSSTFLNFWRTYTFSVRVWLRK